MKEADQTITVPEGKTAYLTFTREGHIFHGHLCGPLTIEINDAGEPFITHDCGLITFPGK